MAYLKIHRGTHQIGGCCTEIGSDTGRILIDFGSNLPDSNDDSQMKDDELVQRVFNEDKNIKGVLFTHYHGDHFGLYKKIPTGIPMYIGGTAKSILQILTEYIDYNSEIKGGLIVEAMKSYNVGNFFNIPGIDEIKVIPLSVDHSALDAYMLYIETGGKRILFSGDFRDHGIASERNQLWKLLDSEEYVPKDIDILITEGTMLSRKDEINNKFNNGKQLILTEAELGVEAGKIFLEHKYNFIMVSSTNLDSIMEFYHNTPDDMPFVCDFYQVRVICEAIKGKKKWSEMYRPKVMQNGKPKPIYLLLDTPDNRIGELMEANRATGLFLPLRSAKRDYSNIQDGFVMLVRPNHYPTEGRKGKYEAALDYFYQKDESQVNIIYSMWKGYLSGEKEDTSITSFLKGHHYQTLHVSGHAYPETILRLIKATNPKTIITMHSEMTDEAKDMPEFREYADRFMVLNDGEVYSI